jgi:hypothetical protein
MASSSNPPQSTSHKDEGMAKPGRPRGNASSRSSLNERRLQRRLENSKQMYHRFKARIDRRFATTNNHRNVSIGTGQHINNCRLTLKEPENVSQPISQEPESPARSESVSQPSCKKSDSAAESEDLIQPIPQEPKSTASRPQTAPQHPDPSDPTRTSLEEGCLLPPNRFLAFLGARSNRSRAKTLIKNFKNRNNAASFRVHDDQANKDRVVDELVRLVTIEAILMEVPKLRKQLADVMNGARSTREKHGPARRIPGGLVETGYVEILYHELQFRKEWLSSPLSPLLERWSLAKQW